MPDSKVENMLKSASEMMRGLAQKLDEAQRENSTLRTQLAAVKAASAGQVTIEKVACSKEKVEAFVDTLVSHHLLDEVDREKMASSFLADPDSVLDQATEAIRLSEWPDEQGHGIKSASREPISPDQAGHAVWDRMLGKCEANY